MLAAAPRCACSLPVSRICRYNIAVKEVSSECLSVSLSPQCIIARGRLFISFSHLAARVPSIVQTFIGTIVSPSNLIVSASDQVVSSLSVHVSEGDILLIAFQVGLLCSSRSSVTPVPCPPPSSSGGALWWPLMVLLCLTIMMIAHLPSLSTQHLFFSCTSFSFTTITQLFDTYPLTSYSLTLICSHGC